MLELLSLELAGSAPGDVRIAITRAGSAPGDVRIAVTRAEGMFHL